MTPFTAEAAAALGGPAWLRDRRAAAAERAGAMAMPTEAEEVWRYSRISELDLDAFGLVDMSGGAPAATATSTAAPGWLSRPPGALVSVHNGRVRAVELSDDLRGRGVVVADVADDAIADGDDLWGSVASTPVDRFTELNTAFAPGAVLVRVPAGLHVDAPIVVVHHVDDGVAAFPRTIVQAGADCDATVVEHHRSGDVLAFVDPVVELDVADAARLHFVSVQELGPRVWQTAYQASRVGRDATLHASIVALGGDYARVRTDSRIEGKGGTSNLLAVYFGSGTQMHDFRTMQDHAAPQSTSDLLFKGAVQDGAQSVYSGLIRVRKGAVGTNAFQTNRNLVLSEGARAESVPNLEIEENQVRCSHASAVGPIDEEQRYYLESRGIPPLAAERLIVLGFFGEVLDRLPDAGLTASLRATIVGRFAGRST